jgi:hypothetical protein
MTTGKVKPSVARKRLTQKSGINRSALQRVLTRDWLPDLLDVALKHGLEPKGIVHFAIACFERSQYRFKIGYAKPIDQSEVDLIAVVKLAIEKRPDDFGSRDTGWSSATQMRQARKYINVLIVSFQEVLDYDPVRFHNQPPPSLRIEDPDYLNEVRSLVTELRQLNAVVGSRRSDSRRVKAAASRLGKHFDKFLGSYAGARWER